MAETSIVEALESFSVDLPGGAPFAVGRGDRFSSSDPIVKGREALFGELTVRSSVPPRPQPAVRATETATAGPGERRAPSRASKVVEKAADAKKEDGDA